MRLILAFLLVTVSTGCSGEAPTDSDPIPGDAKSDTVQSSDSNDDTGTADDTGVVADSGTNETSEDTRPTCPTVDMEPNNSLPSATNLKEINDCDGSGGALKGVTAGGSDADFWHYKGNDTFGCVGGRDRLDEDGWRALVRVRQLRLGPHRAQEL